MGLIKTKGIVIGVAALGEEFITGGATATGTVESAIWNLAGMGNRW